MVHLDKVFLMPSFPQHHGSRWLPGGGRVCDGCSGGGMVCEGCSGGGRVWEGGGVELWSDLRLFFLIWSL